MYKPKKPENTNRLRLDIEPKLPSIYVVEGQFQEAKVRRGCLVELPFKGNAPGQLYILGVQWDTGGDLPVWTLYDQTGSDSKMVWSEQYAPQDIAIMYDVVLMSTSGLDQMSKIPDNLKPVSSSTREAMMEPPPVPPQNFPPPPGYPPAYPGMPQQAPGQGYPSPYPMDPAAMPYPYGYYAMPPGQPGQAMPGQPVPGQMPYPPPGWPMYPAPGGMMPMMPGQMMPGAMPGMPADGTAPPGYPQPMPGSVPAPPEAQAEPAPQVDYTLMAKRAKVQLGKLLVDAKIISEATLDAALKMQELVEEEKITAELAPAALRRHHQKGSAIEQYLDDTGPEIKAEPLPPPDPERIKNAAKLPITPPRSTQEGRAAFDLLQQAGLLSESDIKTAQSVRAKHGGDLLRILQAAGKLDKYTSESSVTCLPMIREGLMKLEQCVIVLQYCNRVRVDFDTAMDELNWPNPRKLRKDLPL